MSRARSIDEVIVALEATAGAVYLAARKLGITAQAIYKRAKKNKRIKRAIDRFRGEHIDLAESQLKLAVRDGKAWAIEFTLKTIGKDRGYCERKEVDAALHGPDEGPIEVRSDTIGYDQFARAFAGVVGSAADRAAGVANTSKDDPAKPLDPELAEGERIS